MRCHGTPAAWACQHAPAIALATVRRADAVAAAAVVVTVTWLAYLLELSGDPRAFAGALPTIALVLLALRVRQRQSAPTTPQPELG